MRLFVATRSIDLLTSDILLIIPLFLLMGTFAQTAGLSTDMYRLAHALLGHFRGGLALATVGARASAIVNINVPPAKFMRNDRFILFSLRLYGHIRTNLPRPDSTGLRTPKKERTFRRGLRSGSQIPFALNLPPPSRRPLFLVYSVCKSSQYAELPWSSGL